jgi:hypothetical protein
MIQFPFKKDLGLAITLLIVLIIGIITMPAEECPGDAMAVRVETVHFLQNGSFGVSAEIATKYWGDRGMFFDQNEVTGQWYPKYGIMNTIVYMPALTVEKLIKGRIQQVSSPLRLFLLNIHNIFLSLLCASSFYLLARLFTSSDLISAIWSLSVIYMTFCWFYLRAQIFEIHTLLFLSWALYFFIRSYRSVRECNIELPGNSTIWLLLSGLCIGAEILSKTVYVLLAGLSFVGWILIPEFRRIICKKHTLLFFTPIISAVILVLISNQIKFGSALNTGYTQWAAESKPLSGELLRGISGYLFDTQWGVFSCFPILLLAVFYWRKFIRNYPIETGIIISVGFILLLVNSCFVNWRGVWSYGPRYLLPILPALSLPSIYLLESILDMKGKTLKIICIITLGVAGIYAVSLQEFMQRYPFYTWYQLDIALSKVYTPAVTRYMYGTPFWQINKDISSCLSGNESPLASLIAEDQYKAVKECIRSLPLNYYWLR